ncbi:hypothetical protein SAMN04488241_102347 [Sphingomonas rubra]|uniref:Uncharacterized protein n=2 Tax=Sphingomonas rubra TaxID=634430 RepID=A0A1I5QX43_9SPHN|nr:hypothetical protein SAMN04488241_102347 [Sphingomonas rubra]
MLLQAAVAPAPMPPHDWAPLPVFPLPRGATTSDGATFVRGEVAAGRCAVPPVHPDGTRMVAPVALLVAPGGTVSRIVPRAIGCSTVEQYTVGYLLSLTRTLPAGAAPLAPGWYRVAVSYRW